MHFNDNTSAKSETDYIHKALPLVWLFIRSENKDALTRLFNVMRMIPSMIPRNVHNNASNVIDVRYHTADNSAAIQSAISSVFPQCQQGNCIVHAKTKLKKKAAELGKDSNEGKLLDKFRMTAPNCPSEISFRAVSAAIINFLKKSSSPRKVQIAQHIEDYYITGIKGNWYHVASGAVSTILISVDLHYSRSQFTNSTYALRFFHSSQPGVTIDNNICESYNRATNRIYSKKGLSLSEFLHDKMPVLLNHAALNYKDYGSPSKFNNTTTSCITSRTIANVVDNLHHENAPSTKNWFHVLHHPSRQHRQIECLNLSPFELSGNTAISDCMFLLVHTSSYVMSEKPKRKQFSTARIKKIENILFGETKSGGSFRYLMNLLDDVRSFHLVMIQKVATLQEVNNSLQDFLPLSEISANRVKESAFSIPDTWKYFRFVCFSKTFFKNNDLDFSCWLLCHCLGIINIHQLTGSIVQTKQYTPAGDSSQVISGKRKRNFDLHLGQKLAELKKKKSYEAYLMQRVCMSCGRNGKVIGVIDGGVNKKRNGNCCEIKSFTVRFLMDRACNTTADHFESLPHSLDQVAIGLVRAKNSGRGGRCKIELDDIAWKTGRLRDGFPLLEQHL